jgi:hypothetical protein
MHFGVATCYMHINIIFIHVRVLLLCFSNCGAFVAQTGDTVRSVDMVRANDLELLRKASKGFAVLISSSVRAHDLPRHPVTKAPIS